MGEETVIIEAGTTETPPVETPPIETPPVETPPIETPLAPSTETPPLETPPVDWRESLPEDLRNDDKIKSFSTVADMAKALTETPEPLTIPDAENYELEGGVKVTPELGKQLQESGFTQKQVDKMIELRSGLNSSEQTARVKKYAEDLGNVIEEWGTDADRNKNIVRATLEQLDSNGEMKKLLETSGEAYNPVVVRFFHRVGVALDEHSLLRMTTNRGGGDSKSAGELFYPTMK